MQKLKEETCVPCRGGEPPLSDEEIQKLRSQVAGWEVRSVDGVQRLVKAFDFADFRQALDFTVRVGEDAESQDHHPVIITEWGRCEVAWWTHKIRGLHHNDFVMAARTNELERGGKNEQGKRGSR